MPITSIKSTRPASSQLSISTRVSSGRASPNHWKGEMLVFNIQWWLWRREMSIELTTTPGRKRPILHSGHFGSSEAGMVLVSLLGSR